MVPNPLESDFWSIGSSISNLFVHSRNMLIGGYMMYNLPLKLILDKLTDIDNKLALLVEQPIDNPIDMLEEMEKEEYDEHQRQNQVRGKANRGRKVSKKEADKA